MLTVTCPGCHRDTDIPDSAANRQFECPHCDIVLDIPRTRKKVPPKKKKPTAATGRVSADDFAEEMTASAKKSKKLTFACLSCGRTVVVRSSGGDVECPRCGEEHSYKEALRESRDRSEEIKQAEGRFERYLWYVAGGAAGAGVLGSLLFLIAPAAQAVGFLGLLLAFLGLAMGTLACYQRDAENYSPSDRGMYRMLIILFFGPFLVLYALLKVSQYPQLIIMLASVVLAAGVSYYAFNRNAANRAKEVVLPGQPQAPQPGAPQPNPPPAPVLPPPGEVPDASGMPGLMAYWRFDEAEGDTARDAVNGAVGTLHGATWVPGIRGKALAFDGKTGWFDFGKSLELNIPNGSAFTVACWVKTSAQSGMVYSFGSGPRGGALSLALTNGKLFSRVQKDGVRFPADLTNPKGFSADTWHHVAITRNNGGRIEMYQDGVSVTSGSDRQTTVGGSVTTGSRYLGRDQRNTPDGYLNGAIDEFVLFERALSAAEIAKLAGR